MPRKAHKPDDQSRKTVKAMAGYGIPQDHICVVLGISGPTLRRHYRSELDVAEIEANAQVAQSLFKQAVGAPAEFDADGNQIREEQKRVPAMGMFWAKTRMGWKETTRLEHGGGIANFDPEKLGELSDDELAIAEKLFGKLAGATGDNP